MEINYFISLKWRFINACHLYLSLNIYLSSNTQSVVLQYSVVCVFVYVGFFLYLFHNSLVDRIQECRQVEVCSAPLWGGEDMHWPPGMKGVER